MNILKYFIIAMIIFIFSFQVLAVQTVDNSCKKIEKIAVNKMGVVDEVMLQKHINKIENSLSRVKRKSGRRDEHRKLLKAHLTDMQLAMKEVYDLKLIDGCLEAEQGASMEIRMMLMKNRMDLMQATMEQMTGHQEEAKRE